MLHDLGDSNFNRFKFAPAQVENVKIQSVEAFPISIKADESLKGGTFDYSHYSTVLVKAVMGGAEGWGEAMTRSDPAATSALVRYLAKGIIGNELDNIQKIWEVVWRGLRVRGHTRGVEVEALSGIELALYDALGKIERKPLGKMLSSHPASSVPVFAGSLFASRGPLEVQVEVAKQYELAGAKVKVGFAVEEDHSILKTVRSLWKDAMLVADANGAYDVTSAAKACDAFADLDLAWFEEPVLSDDLDGYASLRGKGVKIGAGESWFVGDFRKPIEERLVDVIEPSVSRCGGLRVEVDVAKRAVSAGLSFSPMTGMNSVISLAASIHAASVVNSIGVEFNPFPNPLQRELAAGLEQPRKGKIEVPTGDGLGLKIDDHFIRSHSS